MRLRSWAGSVIDTSDYRPVDRPHLVRLWAEGWLRYWGHGAKRALYRAAGRLM